MLRLALLLLLMANGLFWVWSQGLLEPLGWTPDAGREPQRVAQQLRAQELRLLKPDEVRRLQAQTVATAATPARAACLVSAMLDERQAAAVQQAAQTLLPAGSWKLEDALEPGRWLIFMGRFPSNEALNRKKIELRQINIRFEDAKGPGLEPGLNLGAFDNAAAAAQQLNALAARGVRTARVLQERAEVRGKILRLGAVDDALRPRLEGLTPALGGKPLLACKT